MCPDAPDTSTFSIARAALQLAGVRFSLSSAELLGLFSWFVGTSWLVPPSSCLADAGGASASSTVAIALTLVCRAPLLVARLYCVVLLVSIVRWPHERTRLTLTSHASSHPTRAAMTRDSCWPHGCAHILLGRGLSWAADEGFGLACNKPEPSEARLSSSNSIVVWVNLDGCRVTFQLSGGSLGFPSQRLWSTLSDMLASLMLLALQQISRWRYWFFV